ncbi:MAG: hypothetical protein QW409_03175 [Candidatus Aenigmatarchaeota archaeon]
MERKESEELRKIIEEGEKYEKFLDIKLRLAKGENDILKVGGKDRTYYLLKTDGIKLHPAGYFLPQNGEMRFGQLFYAFSMIEKEEKSEIYEDILPFVFEVTYNQEGKIVNTEVKNIKDLNYIELGDTVATFVKKTTGATNLPTQLPLEVVKKIIYNVNLSQNPKEELRKTFESLKEKLLQHIDQDEIIIDIALCWAIASYWYEVFGIIPILTLIGVSGSGKTKFATAICYISKKGLPIADPTDANISRVIDGFKPTLLIDDWDNVMRRKKEIVNSILKHVYKSTIIVPRMRQEKERFVVELFSPYAPLILTTAEPIEDSQLQRRIIELQCKKSQRKFPNIGDYNLYFLNLFKSEREKLYELMFLLLPTIYETFQSLDIDLPQPYLEIWTPILTIAKLLGDDIFSKIYEYAKRIIEEKEEEVYKEEKLILQAISLFFNQQNLEGKNVEVVEFTASELKENLMKIVVDELKEMDEIQFTKYYTPQRIGSILKRMGIKSLRRGKKRERKKTITREELEELCKKFGIELADKTDEADKYIEVQEEISNEKTQEKPEKNQNLKGVDDIYTHTNSSALSASSSYMFSPLERSIFTKCFYCNNLSYVKYKDNEGNYICDSCKNLLESQGEYFGVDEYE